MTSPKLNAIVAVTFWDHVENAKEPARVTAFGMIVKIEPTYLVLNAWVGEDDEVQNNKFFTILRNTITAIRTLS